MGKKNKQELSLRFFAYSKRGREGFLDTLGRYARD
jgi:hypothetical protein